MAHVEDQGVVRRFVLDPVARPLAAAARLLTGSPLLRYALLAGSLATSLALAGVLWADTSYWPPWVFGLTGAASLGSSLLARVARHHGGDEWDPGYEVAAAFAQTLGVATSVLASLHVFQVSPWSALAVVAAVGLTLVAPYAAARATTVVRWGRWSGPDELRLGAAAYCLALSPWHPAAAAAGVGDAVSLVTAAALALPLAAHGAEFRRALPGTRITRDALGLLAGVAVPAAVLAAGGALDPTTARAYPVLFAWTLVPPCASAAARAAGAVDAAVDTSLLDPSLLMPGALFAFRALGGMPFAPGIALTQAACLAVALGVALEQARRPN